MVVSKIETKLKLDIMLIIKWDIIIEIKRSVKSKSNLRRIIEDWMVRLLG